MRVLHIPFGTYVDARPDGRFACLVVDDGPAMQLDTERLTIPRDSRPLYVRVPRDGPFKFAGQSSNSPETIEWIEGTGWVPRPIVPCGISPVIYDHAGTLHISDCGPAVGSQGYRYVDYDTGALVTGDQTLGSDFGLAEWTYLGDGLYVGQCNVTPGCAIWDGTNLRMVEPGDCFFIRGQRVGQDVSLAMVRHAGEPAVIVWATMDELRALPIIQPTAKSSSTGPVKPCRGRAGWGLTWTAARRPLTGPPKTRRSWACTRKTTATAASSTRVSWPTGWGAVLRGCTMGRTRPSCRPN